MRRPLLAAPLIAVALVAACGSGDGGSGRESSDALTVGGRDLGGEEVLTRSSTATNEMPDIVIDDVGRSKKVNLKNVFPAERPVLLWLWAPSCAICGSEAAGVERFASDHGGEVEVIGLGTQDTLDMGVEFVEDHRMESFTMLWDETGLSWNLLGVSLQPSGLLYDLDGVLVQRWIGYIPHDDVLTAVDQIPA